MESLCIQAWQVPMSCKNKECQDSLLVLAVGVAFDRT